MGSSWESVYFAWNLCVSVARKAKWDYFGKFDYKKLTDNKTFGNLRHHFLPTKKLTMKRFSFLRKVRPFLTIIKI